MASGLLAMPDGTSYSGQWRHDEMHGNGTFAEPDGTVYDGKFASGKRHGIGCLTKGASVYSVVYNNGELTQEKFLSTTSEKVGE